MDSTIYLVYEMTGNPYLSFDKNTRMDWISDFTRPTEVNDIIQIILETDFDVIIVDGPNELIERASEIQTNNGIVFNLGRGLTGGLEKKVVVPALCEYFNIKYIGPSSYATTLGRNKFHSNCILNSLGVPVPKSQIVNHSCEVKHIQVPLPVIVKPNNESNSIGVSRDSVFFNNTNLIDKIEWILTTFEQPALIEAYIPGPEYSVSVIGNDQKTRAVGCVENMINGAPVTDKVIQRWDNINRTVTVRELENQSLKKKLFELACSAHQILGARDYSRSDFRLSSSGNPFLIELEHQPDLGLDSTFIPACLQTYKEAREIILSIINSAVERFELAN